MNIRQSFDALNSQMKAKHRQEETRSRMQFVSRRNNTSHQNRGASIKRRTVSSADKLETSSADSRISTS